MIELRNIDVTFKQKNRDVTAVKNVSLSIQDGEVFGIVGPSGAGKSTLVRVVNLLQHPTGGQVIIDGEDITSYSRGRLNEIRLHMGMIFQHFNLISGATVADNIGFALKANHCSKEQIKTRVAELLEMVHLPDKADVYPASLSGGQKQRIAIARALANSPKYLLCDEATSALDLENTEEIVALLKEINQQTGITIVFITHEMEVAKKLFDRIAFMENGEIKEVSDIYTAFSAPREPISRSLVERVLNVTIPDEIAVGREEDLLRLRYTDGNAHVPLISQVSRQFDVSIDIVNGKIDYIHGKPLGVLVILMKGQPDSRAQAIQYMKDHIHLVEEVKGDIHVNQ